MFLPPEIALIIAEPTHRGPNSKIYWPPSAIVLAFPALFPLRNLRNDLGNRGEAANERAVEAIISGPRRREKLHDFKEERKGERACVKISLL